jgi:hypothetical protein
MATTGQAGRPVYASTGDRARGTATAGTAVRYLGALALLAMAVIHLEQYVSDSYSKIPTIGTLFLLNFAGGTVIALGLLSPLDRWGGDRGRVLLPFLAIAGAAMAAVAIAFLLISESTALFGFREAGYRAAIVLALVSEAAAVLCLGGFAAARLSRGANR